MLLEVMRLSRDIGSYFHAIGKPHARYFSECGVWLFGSHGGYFHAYPSLESRGIENRLISQYVKSVAERRRFCFIFTGCSPSFDKLVDGRH